MKYSVYKLSEPFDLSQYKNTRFMYNPNNREIILGSEYDTVENGSHAILFYSAKQNTNTGYDNYFIKGWIGFGGRKYKNGVIHFAPNIRPEQSEVVMQSIDLVERLKKHGFTDNTWVRGLVRFDEYKIKDMYEKIQNWEEDVKPYTEQLQDWVNCSFVKDKVYKIAEGVYTSDKMKARYHNSDLKPYFLLIDSPFYSNGKLTESFENLSQKGFNGIIQGKTFRVFNESEQVKEADAVKDAEHRDRAKFVFDSIAQTIKKKPNVGQLVSSRIQGFGYFMNITQGIEKFYPDIKSDKKLYLLIRDDEGQEKGSFRRFDGYNMITLNILSDNVMNMLANSLSETKVKQNRLIKEYVWAAFMNEENTFLHEFTHAIDEYRLKNYKGRKVSQEKQTTTDYLNDPLEFNAWFQSNIQEFDGIQTFEKEFGKDWNLFYGFVLNSLPFVKEYNEKYRRKFDVRLWKYWNEFIRDGGKKQVSEAKFNYGNLYHGTNASFDEFNKEYITGGYLGKGFYFTMSKNMAKSYGKNVIEAKLNYNNSFMFNSDILDDNSLNKILNTSKADNKVKNDIFNKYKDLVKEYSIFDANAKLFDLMDFYKGDTTKILKELGYDSIDNIERDSEFLVFEPEQIKIIKQIDESIKDEGGFFITNSGQDILNLLQNKPKEYRIVYDANLNLFMICDANEGIHQDMLEKAYNNGLYYNLEKFIDSLGTFQNYIETGQDGGWDENDEEIESYLYYMVFDPTGQWQVGDDGYDTIYKLPFGNLLTRKCDLSEIPFYDMLPLTEQLNEGVNTQYLYHAMWKKQFLRCKKDNRLYSHIAYENYKTAHRTIKGISTSRNIDVCIKFMERAIKEMTDEWKKDPNSYFSMNDTGNDGTAHYIDKGADLSYVILVFDREKLKQNHKIIPHSYIGGQMRDTFGDEQEELIVGDLPNFMDYVVDVMEFNNNINSKTLKSKKNVVENFEPNLNQNFWKWFGDSVCVDDTGAPLVLYHGTSSEFNKFKKGLIFTTDNEQVADGYGYYGAMPVFVRIRKPFIVDAFNQDWQEIYNAEGFKKKYKDLTDEDIEKLYKAYEYFESLEDAKQYYEESKKYNPDDYINLARAYGQKPHSTNEWAQYAKNKGYDGCIIKNVVDGFSLSDCINPINEYIVWNPEQVKSVNNNGEWSESDELLENTRQLTFYKDVYVIDSPQSLMRYLQDTKPYDLTKILYDRNKNFYIVGSGDTSIHIDLLIKAANEGWYDGLIENPKDDNDIDYYWDLQLRKDNLQPFSFSKEENVLGDDGNEYQIKYDFGSFFTKVEWLPTDLANYIGNGEIIENQNELMESFDTRKITVYHGSSDKNLKIKDNSTIFFTNNKDDAERWAKRLILGGKKNKENYIYKAEITFNKPYIIGDSEANPEYNKFKDIENEKEKKDIYTEIFFDDIVNNYKEFVAKGYDCFIDNMIGNGITYYVIPSEFKNNVKWLEVEKI